MYNKQMWVDKPAKVTPINAEHLNHIEDGIYDASSKIESITRIFLGCNAVTLNIENPVYIYEEDGVEGTYSTSEDAHVLTASYSLMEGTGMLPDGVSPSDVPEAIIVGDTEYLFDTASGLDDIFKTDGTQYVFQDSTYVINWSYIAPSYIRGGVYIICSLLTVTPNNPLLPPYYIFKIGAVETFNREVITQIMFEEYLVLPIPIKIVWSRGGIATIDDSSVSRETVWSSAEVAYRLSNIQDTLDNLLNRVSALEQEVFSTILDVSTATSNGTGTNNGWPVAMLVDPSGATPFDKYQVFFILPESPSQEAWYEFGDPNGDYENAAPVSITVEGVEYQLINLAEFEEEEDQLAYHTVYPNTPQGSLQTLNWSWRSVTEDLTGLGDYLAVWYNSDTNKICFTTLNNQSGTIDSTYYFGYDSSKPKNPEYPVSIKFRKLN